MDGCVDSVELVLRVFLLEFLWLDFCVEGEQGVVFDGIAGESLRALDE